LSFSPTKTETFCLIFGYLPDFYNDDQEVGYAVINGKKLIEDVYKIVGNDERRTVVFVHNCVEAALDIEMQKVEDFGQWHVQAIKLVDLKVVADCSSDFWDYDRQDIFNELEKLVEYLTLEHLKDEKSFARHFVKIMSKKYNGVETNPLQIENLIKRARGVISNSWKSYSESTITSMKRNWGNLIK